MAIRNLLLMSVALVTLAACSSDEEAINCHEKSKDKPMVRIRI